MTFQRLLTGGGLAALGAGLAGCATSPAASPTAEAPAPAPIVIGTEGLPRTLAPRPTAGPINVADLMTRVYIFSADSMMGRQVGTIYNDRGTAYIEREVRRLGLRPAGENGGYFQSIPLMMHSFSPQSRITTDGGQSFVGRVDFWERDNRVFGPQVSVRSVDGTQAVYGGLLRIGPGGAPDTSLMIDRRNAAGKFLIFTLPRVNGQLQWQGLRQPLTVFYQGAAGVAVVALDAITPAERDTLLGPERVLSLSSPQGMGIDIPSFMYIGERMARELLGADPATLTRGAAGKMVHTAVEFTPTQLPGRNVIAVLPGSDPVLRNQYVVVGAHNDHIGFTNRPVAHDSMRAYLAVVRPRGADDQPRDATPAEAARIRTILDSLRRIRPTDRPDSINNGADDDASGSMALLEIAEAMATSPTKPRRSILFIWHTGEEEGLWGSDHFTRSPTVPRDSIVAAINVDMIGRGGATDLPNGGPGYLQLIGSRRLSTQLGDLVESVAKTQPTPFRFDYQYDAEGHPSQYYCRSDHYNYARYGIPVVFFSTGGHRDYHQVTDEPQYINFDQLHRVTQLIHDVTMSVGNLAQRPVVDKPKPASPFAPCRQ